MSFRFKQFTLHHDQCLMKVGTDGILVGAWANAQNCRFALDIGTGCGLIALMLAQRFPKLYLHAVETHISSARQARKNVSISPFSERIQVIQDTIQAYAQYADQSYDLIVSNPPFFNTGLRRNTARHTDKLPYTDLLNCAKKLLSPEGLFCLILPLEEGLQFIELAKDEGFFLCEKTIVCPKASKKADRLLLAFSFRCKIKHITKNLIIRKENGVYTEIYKKLTETFYL